MKAKLIFNLPEDTEDFNLAVNGVNYSISIDEFDQKLRAMEKYEDKETIKISECRDILREILFDNDVKIR